MSGLFNLDAHVGAVGERARARTYTIEYAAVDEHGNHANVDCSVRVRGAQCGDSDGDGCDDCWHGVLPPGRPDDDGPDADSDGICDLSDTDDDNDGALDAADSHDADPNLCSDVDGDGCDDCTSGQFAASDDGPDFDGDGACDAGDLDDDDDGRVDADDPADFNPAICGDSDADGCDDCTNGLFDPANDGPDFDGDGQCDAGDPDDDNDGALDADDVAPHDPNTCSDIDNDTCEDCLSGSFDPNHDGEDSDSDGFCDAGVAAGANRAGVVQIAADPPLGTPPQEIELTAHAVDADGEIVGYTWDFGDGTTVNGGAVVRHTYAAAGEYTARVRARDNLGAVATAEVVIRIEGTPVRHAMLYPARVAIGPQGRLFVSDPEVGSVFILDAALDVVGELSGIERPLGIAVTADRIYVGSMGIEGVEVFDHHGARVGTIDPGGIAMPNEIVVDARGRIFVADSRSDAVRVYGPDGASLGMLDGGQGWSMRFPSALALAERPQGDELYVGDQTNGRIHVYSPATLEHIRVFGGRVEAFSADWKGRFVRLQSLAIDAAGRLHVLDSQEARVQVLDPWNGEFVETYGSFGVLAGGLNLPLDLVITATGEVIASCAGNRRLERVHVVGNAPGGAQ